MSVVYKLLCRRVYVGAYVCLNVPVYVHICKFNDEKVESVE